MFAGRAAYEDAETGALQDRHVIPIVRPGGRVEPHVVGPASQLYQWQRDCRDKVFAHLFHQAIEVGMKTLPRADSWNNDSLRELRHRLATVWTKVDERYRDGINRIFDKKS